MNKEISIEKMLAQTGPHFGGASNHAAENIEHQNGSDNVLLANRDLALIGKSMKSAGLVQSRQERVYDLNRAFDAAFRAINVNNPKASEGIYFDKPLDDGTIVTGSDEHNVITTMTPDEAEDLIISRIEKALADYKSNRNLSTLINRAISVEEKKEEQEAKQL